MSVASLPIIVGEFPSGYCWPSPQTFANDFAALATVQLDITGATIVLRQNTTPGATQRDSLWYNTDTGHVLYWNSSVASWVMTHPVAAGGDERRIFMGLSTDIDTYDGGAVGTVSASSGPMWERDTTFNDRGLLGVGTTATTAGATGGAATVTIVKANLPTDKLVVDTAIVGQAGVGTDVPVVGNTYGSTSISGSGRAVDSTATDLAARYYSKGQTEAMGLGTALNVQNPYVGVFLLKRTARQFYTT